MKTLEAGDGLARLRHKKYAYAGMYQIGFKAVGRPHSRRLEMRTLLPALARLLAHLPELRNALPNRLHALLTQVSDGARARVLCTANALPRSTAPARLVRQCRTLYCRNGVGCLPPPQSLAGRLVPAWCFAHSSLVPSRGCSHSRVRSLTLAQIDTPSTAPRCIHRPYPQPRQMSG